MRKGYVTQILGESGMSADVIFLHIPGARHRISGPLDLMPRTYRSYSGRIKKYRSIPPFGGLEERTSLTPQKPQSSIRAISYFSKWPSAFNTDGPPLFRGEATATSASSNSKPCSATLTERHLRRGAIVVLAPEKSKRPCGNTFKLATETLNP